MNDGAKFKDRYRVIKKLPNQGGMGFVVFAFDETSQSEVVIKFCQQDANDEMKRRFIREIRLLIKHQASGFTVPILDHSIDSEPLFFVMPKAKSDLTVFCSLSLEEKEKLFYRMIDCVSYLHEEGDLHRDIKPENFLDFDGTVLLSDLGLAKDPSSTTNFTQSIDARGTPVYSPPNFFESAGGFKNPTIADDLFSLGKAFYFILSAQIPYYVVKRDIPDAIFEVIKKATEHSIEKRYSSCEQIRRDLKSAFDIVLGRIDTGSMYFKFRKGVRELSIDDFTTFVGLLKTMDATQKVEVFDQHSEFIFRRVAESHHLAGIANTLVEIYWDIDEHIRQQKYWPFSYAEQVSNDIFHLFEPKFIDDEVKANGLKVALHFAIRMNRGAAGETCAKIIESIVEDRLALLCSRVIESFGGAFVFEHIVKPEKCHHDLIIKAILASRKSS